MPQVGESLERSVEEKKHQHLSEKYRLLKLLDYKKCEKY